MNNFGISVYGQEVDRNLAKSGSRMIREVRSFALKYRR